MQNPQFSQKIILNHIITAEKILKAMAGLNHAVYLQNNGFPVIAFCADEYFILQNSQLTHCTQQELNSYRQSPADQLPKIFNNILKENNNKAFKGGYMGFISYDYGASQHVNLAQKHQPSLFLGHFSTFLTWSETGWELHCPSENFIEMQTLILKLMNAPETPSNFKLRTACSARWTKAQYAKAFHHVQEYIKAGDCYQINLTQEFTALAEGQLLDTAARLWALTDAPYSGYLRIDDFELLSCSPELFIDFEAERKIITKPIKGTMPRFTDPILDAQSKQTLENSEKDQAENVMIVDLLRNDLSVYAETGSVKTPKLFNIESFNQVHHMVSEVEATLKPGVNPFNMLLSALPGGSITGAPKIRAMQIIDELEGAPRGAYCGSLGYFNEDGTGSWNILIRSIQKYQNNVSLWAGGGITVASDCDAEYQECFDKVSAILDLLNTWHQPN
ncbi:anthranilate synthase component I family protein [Acinetobacter pragensis]|uniref:Aminobenzoate synthetase n=1 Tax=Acinetobacter pragensis TaxID=1806892 RepID=A0A151Y0V0_9GAMM|nr:anthranilate synthase component I family protein [Acinetobacter pragensis]KYQ71624.1 aminobenzoate synthetase [Acinetobacter pragensis]